MNTLKKRLTALYTATTGGIFFLVILAFLMVSIHKAQSTQLEQFQLVWNSLSSRFLSATTLSHSFLAQMEADYRIIIHIRENGSAFLFPGAWNPPDNRETLIAETKKLAEAQGVFMDRAPVSSTINTSALLNLQGESGNHYYAMVLAVPTKRGVKSLCVIAFNPPLSQTLEKTMLYLGFLFILGLVCLGFISWKFVDWSLLPVEESQKKQAQFIAAASHELRSPLAVLRSGLTTLAALPEKKDTLLPLLDHECVRMSRLIEDMLLLASADAKNWKLNWEMVDVDTLLIDLLEAYQPVCREKNILLKLELPSDTLPPLPGDPQRICQILQILLDNACQFTPAGKSIILCAKSNAKELPSAKDAKKKWIDLQVIDEGCGIAPKDRPYIFDRFYQADSSRSDKQHVGLGLSIAKELTELHGGKISVGEDEQGRNYFMVSLACHPFPGCTFPPKV